ncbi:MAG: glycoside hydrolase family 3 protein [Chitinophagales bacterium]|nr:glycoside hydrolase family 3 protein [Chitinophagales bacterium]
MKYIVPICLLVAIVVGIFKNLKAQKLFQDEVEIVNDNFKQSNFDLSDFYSNNPYLDKQVEEKYQSLTTKQKAAQIIMYAVSSTDATYTYSTTLKLLQDTIIDNVIFLKGDINIIKKQIDLFNEINKDINKLYACDCEPYLFNMKYFNTPKVPKTNLLNTNDDVINAATTIAETLLQTGITVNFAPVIDNNKNTSVISGRAFSNDTAIILEKSKLFIDVTQGSNIATSIKHFPGHGSVVGDSHKNLVYINGKMEEVATFKSSLQEANPIFVMVGHIAVKNNEAYNTNNLPSTISKNIVTGLLKDKLNFKGIAITDAMNMLGVATIPNADFKALEAGNDIILMPSNPRKLSTQIVATLQQNNDLSQQIEASIKKVIRLKICQQQQ